MLSALEHYNFDFGRILPAIASGFAFEPDEKSISRRNEIVFFHSFRKSITKCLDDFGIVRPRSII